MYFLLEEMQGVFVEDFQGFMHVFRAHPQTLQIFLLDPLSMLEKLKGLDGDNQAAHLDIVSAGIADERPTAGMEGIAAPRPYFLPAIAASTQHRLIACFAEDSQEEQGAGLQRIASFVQYLQGPGQKKENRRVGVMLPGKAKGQLANKGGGDKAVIGKAERKERVFKLCLSDKIEAVPLRRNVVDLQESEFFELVAESLFASFGPLGDCGGLPQIGTVEGYDFVRFTMVADPEDNATGPAVIHQAAGWPNPVECAECRRRSPDDRGKKPACRLPIFPRFRGDQIGRETKIRLSRSLFPR